MVAPSFQQFEQLGEPYLVSGKMYVMVRNPKTGTERQVRWYNDKEYQKAYPDKKDAVASSTVASSQKTALGFDEGYITIFKGDTYPCLEWFQERKECRYAHLWGWYVVSTEQVPTDLPAGISAVRLPWESVGQTNGTLKPETAIKQAIDALLYEAGSSEWMGKVGERLDLVLTVTLNRSVENNYGVGHIHHFEDADGNLYGWFTNARDWPVGETKTIRGTVKELSLDHNRKITWLTRCQEVKGK
jgi:hypothetical protein